MARFRQTYRILTLILISLILGACRTLTEVEGTPTASASATHVNKPTSTSTSTPSPQLVILLAPPEANPAQISSIEPVLSDLAGEVGLVWETRSSLALDDINSSIRLVIALSPTVGLDALAAASLDVQFLGIGILDLSPTSNLSVIGPLGWRHDQQGFLAGYIAAMIAPDWRAGVISLNDTPAGRAGLNGFINGARYFCGVCRPIYPPYLQYPQYVGMKQEEVDATWRVAVDTMVQASVKVVYVSPEVGSAAMLDDFAQQGVIIIGGEEPAPQPRSQWVATIHPDPAQALLILWEDLLAGQGGALLPMPLVITEVNDDLLSPGRQHLAEATMQELLNGYIDTNVDPLTGDTR